MELRSTLTCPRCGHKETLVMPVNACIYFHQCKGCAAVLMPLKGDCCVFCSYGDVRCPPQQKALSVVEPGVQRFEVQPEMPGRWELLLVGHVMSETDAIPGGLVGVCASMTRSLGS